MKYEFDTAAVLQLADDVRRLLSDLPQDAVAVSYEKKDFMSSETVRATIELPGNVKIQLYIDRPTSEAAMDAMKYNWKSVGPGGCDTHCIEHPCGPCITGKTFAGQKKAAT